MACWYKREFRHLYQGIETDNLRLAGHDYLAWPFLWFPACDNITPTLSPVMLSSISQKCNQSFMSKASPIDTFQPVDEVLLIGGRMKKPNDPKKTRNDLTAIAQC